MMTQRPLATYCAICFTPSHTGRHKTGLRNKLRGQKQNGRLEISALDLLGTEMMDAKSHSIHTKTGINNYDKPVFGWKKPLLRKN
jgi:hypothetical protein